MYIAMVGIYLTLEPIQRRYHIQVIVGSCFTSLAVVSFFKNRIDHEKPGNPKRIRSKPNPKAPN